MPQALFISFSEHETLLVNNYFLVWNFPFRKPQLLVEKKILNESCNQFLKKKKKPHSNLKECLFYFPSPVISENVLTIRIYQDIFQSIICCSKNPGSVLNRGGCCVLSEDLSNFSPHLWSCSLPAQFSIYSRLRKPSGFQLSLSQKLGAFFSSSEKLKHVKTF